MNWQNQLSRFTTYHFRVISQAAKSHHGRFILLGLLVGLVYLPQWIGYLLPRALKGKTGWFLILCMLCMTGFDLWTKRALLTRFQASEEDRWLGYALIIVGVLIFPFCRFALWSQALVWLAVLVGIAIATWGLRFLYHFPAATFLGGFGTLLRRISFWKKIWRRLVAGLCEELGLMQCRRDASFFFLKAQ